MTNVDDVLSSSDNSLAFHFTGGIGVSAANLGDFLRYAATLARREKIELEVVGIERGSLTVRLLAKVNEEFNAAPVATGAATLAILGFTATLLSSFVPSPHPTPIAKVAIKMIEEGSVEKIEIIANGEAQVVMDHSRAGSFRHQSGQFNSLLQPLPKVSRYSQTEEVQFLTRSARDGELLGEAFDVEGKLHFRPDGYKYLVPIIVQSPGLTIKPGHRHQVQGELVTRNGQPDSIIISSARAI